MYRKTLLNTFFLLVFKIVESLQYILDIILIPMLSVNPLLRKHFLLPVVNLDYCNSFHFDGKVKTD